MITEYNKVEYKKLYNLESATLGNVANVMLMLLKYCNVNTNLKCKVLFSYHC